MPTTAVPPVTVRLLPPEEHHRLLTAPGPFQGLAQPPDPNHSRVIVVEGDDGQIYGSWTLHDTVHAEPVYLTPAVRKSPRVVRALTEAVLEQLVAHGVQTAFVLIEDDNTEVLEIARRLGFQQLPGRAFALQFPEVPA